MLYEKFADHLPLLLSFCWGLTISQTIRALWDHKGNEDRIARAIFDTKDLKKYLPMIMGGCVLVALSPIIGAKPNIAFGVSTIIGMLCILQYVVTQYRRPKLHQKMKEAISQTSVCGMNFSFGGAPHEIQFWFRETNKDWPKVSLELAVDNVPIPVKIIPAKTLENLGEIMYPAMKSHFMGQVLQQAKQELGKAGITHPIDIDGWDQSELTQDLIEQIFETEEASA